MKKRLLISGFEAFGGDSLNPTQKLVQDLSWLKLSADWSVHAVLLPVTFAESYTRLAREIQAFDPGVVVSLGLAGGRAKIGIERVAINRSDARIADNAGYSPVDEPIVAGAPDGLFATLPLRRMVDAGEHANVACEISDSAGTYVCNYLFYRLLESHRFTTRRCGFIHVPYLPEQTIGKTPPPPSMSVEELKRTLNVLIGAAVK